MYLFRNCTCLLAVILCGCALPESELANAHYPGNTGNTVYRCGAHDKSGKAGSTDGRLTQRGIRYFVRTPLNYDSRIAHPLVMVFAPGDRDGLGTEWFTKLTTEGTRNGFIVVYADNRPRSIPLSNRPLAKEWIIELGTIPSLVAADWCVDLDKVFLTGHSNGGTISTALALLQESLLRPAAIAPSGAGFRGQDFTSFACPPPTSVLVMHSKNDTLFPGYGAEAIQWWKQCNQCSDELQPVGADCVSYLRCVNNVSTIYCEGTAKHGVWPQQNRQIMSLFTSVK